MLNTFCRSRSSQRGPTQSKPKSTTLISRKAERESSVLPVQTLSPVQTFSEIEIPCDENWDSSETEQKLNLTDLKEDSPVKPKTVITNTFNDHWSIEALKKLKLNSTLIIKTNQRPDFSFENLVSANFENWKGNFEREVVLKEMTTLAQKEPAINEEEMIRFNIKVPKNDPMFFDVGTQTDITGNRYEGGCPDLRRKCLYDNYQLYEQSYLLPTEFPKLYKTELDYIDEEPSTPGEFQTHFENKTQSSNLVKLKEKSNKCLIAIAGTERENDDPGFSEENTVPLIPFVPRFDHRRNVELITEMNHARL